MYTCFFVIKKMKWNNVLCFVLRGGLREKISYHIAAIKGKILCVLASMTSSLY